MLQEWDYLAIRQLCFSFLRNIILFSIVAEPIQPTVWRVPPMDRQLLNQDPGWYLPIWYLDNSNFKLIINILNDGSAFKGDASDLGMILLTSSSFSHLLLQTRFSMTCGASWKNRDTFRDDLLNLQESRCAGLFSEMSRWCLCRCF